MVQQSSFPVGLVSLGGHCAILMGEGRERVYEKALRVGVKKEESKDFEEAWISGLKQAPEDVTDLEAWRDCEQWDE